MAFSGPALEQEQREHGICSLEQCDQPIAGWCYTCDQIQGVKAYKLCREHLWQHCSPRYNPWISNAHVPHWTEKE